MYTGVEVIVVDLSVMVGDGVAAGKLVGSGRRVVVLSCEGRVDALTQMAGVGCPGPSLVVAGGSDPERYAEVLRVVGCDPSVCDALTDSRASTFTARAAGMRVVGIGDDGAAALLVRWGAHETHPSLAAYVARLGGCA